MNQKKSFLLTILFAAFILDVCAQDGFKLAITHENDFFFIRNNDENYTGGLSIATTFKAWNFWQPFFQLKESDNYQLISLGGTGYTPLDIATPEIVENDRPYSSLVYLSFGRQSVSKKKIASLTSKLIIGEIGGSGPGNVQYFLHDNHILGSTRPNPLGWKNQIAEGGSFVINYNVQYMQGFGNPENWNPRTTLTIPYWTAGVELGNYLMNIQGGLYVDLLNINSFPVFGVDNQPVAAAIMANFDGSNSNKKKCFRMNLYFNPSILVVGYNATLQGKLFSDNSIYTIPSEKIRRFVIEPSAGLNMLIGDTVLIRYTVFGRTQEFEGGKKFHTWGGLTLGVAWGGFFNN